MRPTAYRRNARGPRDRQAFERVRMQADALFAAGHAMDTLIGALEELRGLLGGQKVTLLWDGRPAHRSRMMRARLRRQRSWLVVEPPPGYAPS